ncbi:MAG: acetyl-CoA carboxylase biotin carboxylase subunit [Candidatus Ratteibacteria bacterium]
MIRRVFIANRGEIALRVIRACRDLGITSIIGYSEADRESLPVALADEKICIGPAPSTESYLNIPAIITSLEAKDADAVHPGYGFLAENSFFVEACISSGILFIGPEASTMRLMGDKSEARRTMRRIRVPVTPGADDLSDSEEALRSAKKIRFPVMIKASGGGGGRGMRVARTEKEFLASWLACRQEAQIAFDNPSLYIEKFIDRPRHIEIQVLADTRGNIMAFPERDCSLQRRHQKLVEESPSPMVSPRLRRYLQNVSRRICRAIRYSSVGTIEFLMDGSMTPYFMEMNTRIQVEHPVTEMVSDIDLVRAQLMIAMNAKLNDCAVGAEARGHSIECRINAEDPEKNFLPAPGTITKLILPGGPGIRVDTHVYEGYTIPPFYDSLIAKIISYGKDRQEAVARMKRALYEFRIEGLSTTLPFHRRLFAHPVFLSGRYYVGWLEKFIESEGNGDK